MAINWNFNAEDVEEHSFEPIPVGEHRVRVEKAEECKSKKSGNDMIAVTLQVSGHVGKLFHYLVFMPDNTTLTNTKLKEFWESFGIQQGDLNTANWIGKVGGAKVKHETDPNYNNGEPKARISYFLKKDKQEKLPPWQEPAGIASVTGGNGGFTQLPESSFNPFQEQDEVPF
ncbi:DUF669 domain-containing protein [Intestinibacillus massiliensis]|nr:DUF669 domain-containing protein [Intestinibacillus massiliensis]